MLFKNQENIFQFFIYFDSSAFMFMIYYNNKLRKVNTTMKLRKKKLYYICLSFIAILVLAAAILSMVQVKNRHKFYKSLSGRTAIKTAKEINIPCIDPNSAKPDKVPPVITLLGEPEIWLNIGQNYTEPGFTAADDLDGDLTQSVAVSGTIDSNTSGSYILTYQVKDKMQNRCEVKRIIHVGDFTAPVITLAGANRIYVKVGETYTEPGYSASDNIDGNLTSKLTVSGHVDTSKMGRNKLTYTVADSAGNTATATRSVYVYRKQAIANPVNPGDKVVYLTFDDGPSRHTARLLEILDKYNVKATFFVTNQFPAYQNMIGESHRRGHTIALHTYSHNYADIYSSEDAYYHDLSLIHDVCVAQTGVDPTIIRFPGGTNNKVSSKYCAGIMTALSQEISYHGYLYSDWNVSSGDAGGVSTRERVAANVITGIQKNSVSIVLQHDIKEFSVEAVDDIIFWGLEHDYTFLPMTDTTPMVHYKPNN